jgi:hypothetical protein
MYKEMIGMNKKSIILILIMLTFSLSAFSLAPIQVSIYNTTNEEAAVNYKYNGNYAYEFNENMWDAMSEGVEKIEWLFIPPKTEVKILIDRLSFVRILMKNKHNGLWYTHLQIPLQAYWEGQQLKIREF